MGNKRLGCIGFLVADLSKDAKYAIELMNEMSEIIPGSIVAIVSDDILQDAQSCLFDRMKLYNISMRENKCGKGVAKCLLDILQPELLLVLQGDIRALSFANYSHLKVQKLIEGEKVSITYNEIVTSKDKHQTATFIIKHIEDSRNLDFYPKYYAHEKALNSQMQPGELFNALFFKKKRVEADFLLAWGYVLPKDPLTYNEKLHMFKLQKKYRSYHRYTDKYKVRKLIKKMGYESLLPKCFCVNNYRITAKMWDALPNRFVIKHTNSSGYNIIVKDKSQEDLTVINRVLQSFKHVRYGLRKNEPVYPFFGKIICTEFIEDLTDYKFFCFNGRVKFVAIVKEWFKESKSKEPFQIIVDREFNELPFSYGYERGTVTYEKPLYYDVLVRIVEDIAKGIPHVRIDMMGNEQSYYFGEFTFFPGGGRDRFNPPEYDRIVGSYIE